MVWLAPWFFAIALIAASILQWKAMVRGAPPSVFFPRALLWILCCVLFIASLALVS